MELKPTFLVEVNDAYAYQEIDESDFTYKELMGEAEEFYCGEDEQAARAAFEKANDGYYAVWSNGYSGLDYKTVELIKLTPNSEYPEEPAYDAVETLASVRTIPEDIMKLMKKAEQIKQDYLDWQDDFFVTLNDLLD